MMLNAIFGLQVSSYISFYAGILLSWEKTMMNLRVKSYNTTMTLTVEYFLKCLDEIWDEVSGDAKDLISRLLTSQENRMTA